jgi:hypothetical protein
MTSSASSADQKTREQARDEEGHRVLVEHSHAGQRAGGEPPPRGPLFPVFADALQRRRAGEPEERLQRIDGHQVAEAEQERRGGDAESGERLRERAAAQATSKHRRSERDRGVNQRGRQSKEQDRAVRCMKRQRRQRGKERRLIDEAPGQALAADDEVELVAEEAIA